MMFPDRSPSDVHLYTTFIGGSRNQELAKASTDELKQVVTSDLQRLLGVEGEPVSVNHYYWRKAFPLYDSSYDSVMEAIDKMENDLPGFFYAGNFNLKFQSYMIHDDECSQYMASRRFIAVIYLLCTDQNKQVIIEGGSLLGNQ
jgi:hypothetical protein